MAPNIEITEGELLNALADATRGGPKEAKTVEELTQITGMTNAKVRAALGRLAMSNRLMCSRVLRPTITGTSMPKPAYTILPPPKKKK